VLEIYPAHRDAVKIERLIRCILPTRISLEASRYAEARDRLETWVAEHQDDVEARELLAESYYHLALSAIQTKDWRQAGKFLRMLRQINPQYRDTAEWIQCYPLLGWLSGAIRIIAIPNEFSGSKSIAFSPDSRLMVSVHWDDVKIWEVASTMLLHILKGHKDHVNSVAFSPDGYCLASGSDDKTIKIWDVAAGQLLYSIDVGSRVLSVAFSVNGTLASGTGDGQIKIWLLDEKSAYLLNTISGHKGVVHSVAFSPDGELLASGSVDRTVKIWTVYSSSKNPLHLIDELKNSVYSVVFSPDGRLLASGTSNAVNIWEVDSARLLHTLIGHESTVMSVAFSPDGHLLASGSTDGMLKIWEVSSGQILHTLSVDECESASEQLLDTLLYGYKRKRIEVVYSLTFSPDGRLLASGSSNAVCICSVETGVLTGGASND
jgi:WD40 repeat protein